MNPDREAEAINAAAAAEERAERMERDDKLAFPFVSHGGWSEHQFIDASMTLRDYFAAKALQGLLAGVPHTSLVKAAAEVGVPVVQHTAHAAYEWADAMLAAREAK